MFMERVIGLYSSCVVLGRGVVFLPTFYLDSSHLCFYFALPIIPAYSVRDNCSYFAFGFYFHRHSYSWLHHYCVST